MSLMVLDRDLAERLKAERHASGGDRYDEVWEGVYMMAPLANNEHQHIQSGLVAAIMIAVGWGAPVRVLAGANVSDREAGWEHNYRCPDVVVAFPNGAARDCGTHWCGGPDFCVEIASPGDRSRQKLDFYAGIGVRELLLIDRDPWKLELYRLNSGRLGLVGRSDLSRSDAVASTVVPVSFRLVPGPDRPAIDVAHRDGVQHWLV
jgi:Uma2 family endonuclease